ncbi:MAG TPA: GGDEF domain-containing protein [Candidatus Cloacimonadota bacterium]|jgi:diguanylate cyclase (GGDEF)-like protein|nr:GGDEF domain-containing protein [Candidatus Cloacimonadales bacterium]HPY96283.1 GGDEF domain-containing protein [Candidatus Cloacimonadota bacterium]HQB40207.1 GGDEF domain-containing protein [Candidatus Cloacimonadota bacterium]
MSISGRQLLEGKKRVWDLDTWLRQTKDFMIQEINSFIKKEKYDTIFLRKTISENALSCLNNNKVFTKDIRNKIIVSYIFFQTKEYKLSEEYITSIIDKIIPKTDDENRIKSYIDFCFAQIYLQKADYRRSNEFFIKSFFELKNSMSSQEKIFFMLSWCILFIECKFYNYADQLLSIISSFYLPRQDDNYARLLYLNFLNQKKQNNLAAAINWTNVLLPMDTNSLDEDDWYSVHIFAGEYYATINKNFDKSIYHFTFANSFLSLKWKKYISFISELKNYLKISDYLKVRLVYEDKMLEIILENNLHSSHYLHSLKSAYEELELLYKQVHEMSMTDSLTSLNNRHYLWDKAPEFMNLANLQNVSISCIMIDIDDFKKINDLYGHQVGDDILKQLGAIIKNYFRKSDIVVRFGGEEFLILLLKSNFENSKILCQKLKEKIEDQIFSVKGIEIKISVSIGISYRKNVVNSLKLLEEMIEEADLAMYYSKTNGKNQVTFYKKKSK